MNDVLLKGRALVVSVSGGKDSTAAALWLKEQGLPALYVHADTGWEAPETEEYVRGPLQEALGPITILQSARGGMVDWIRHKGMFPSRFRRYCTDELKVRPISDFIRGLGVPVVNVTGIRADESEKRSLQPEWEPAPEDGRFDWGGDCLFWRPLLRWSYEDVISIHQRHGLRPNPLYLRGAERVGCFPCIFARKSEIRMVANTHPERIDLIERLEAEVADLAAARYAARGETFESLGYVKPAMFQAREGGKGASGAPWPIRRVVDWSRTVTRRGDDEPFTDPMSGCARWGMCETHPTEPAE